MFDYQVNFAKYLFEAFKDSPKHNDSMKTALPDPVMRGLAIKHNHFAASLSASLGKLLYDMCVNIPNPSDRALTGDVSAKILLLTDHTDNMIDEYMTESSEKSRYMKEVSANLFNGARFSSPDPTRQVSFELATNLYETFLKGRDATPLRNAAEYTVSAIEDQFEETDEEELLEIARRIGAGCTWTMQSIVEIVTGEAYPDIAHSAMKLGEYAEFYDHLNEVGDDLKFNLHTYSTAVLSRLGNSKNTRRLIRKRLSDEAKASYTQGLKGLSPMNVVRYNLVKGVIDLKPIYLLAHFGVFMERTIYE